MSVAGLARVSVNCRRTGASFCKDAVKVRVLYLTMFAPVLRRLMFQKVLFKELGSVLSGPFTIKVSTLVFTTIRIGVIRFVCTLVLNIILTLLVSHTKGICTSVVKRVATGFVTMIQARAR